MDTDYTKGFKAGMKFKQDEIIKILTDKYSELTKSGHWAESNYFVQAIALIKGEK